MRLEAFLEIVALEHSRQRVLRGQLDHACRSELAQPLVVESDLGFLRIEDLENLSFVSLGVFEDLFMRQRRPRDLFAGRISDQSREVADDEDDAMSELLKMLHLPNHDRVAEVKIGRGGIEADFHGQRFAPRELGAEVFAIDQVDRSLGEVIELFINIHRRAGIVWNLTSAPAVFTLARLL